MCLGACRRALTCRAEAGPSTRAASLRALLAQPDILKVPPALRTVSAACLERCCHLKVHSSKMWLLQAPCCHDGLSARLIEQAGAPTGKSVWSSAGHEACLPTPCSPTLHAAGFPAAFMSGFSTSAARLGAPDMGLLSYGEVIDQGRRAQPWTACSVRHACLPGCALACTPR